MKENGRREVQALHVQLCELEEEIIKGRIPWLEQEKGSIFSYWLYDMRVKAYREEWAALEDLEHRTECAEKLSQETGFSELMCRRMKEIIKQGEINRDDFPEDREVAARAGQIIQKAKSLMDYWMNKYPAQ